MGFHSVVTTTSGQTNALSTHYLLQTVPGGPDAMVDTTLAIL
ncbi:hypothetical protein ACSMXN_14205 [Jatrophihabitans sp. DSM 45814]